MKFYRTPISSILNRFLGKKSPISHFKVCNLHIWQIIFELIIFWCSVIVFIQSLPDFSVEGGAKVWITLYAWRSRVRIGKCLSCWIIRCVYLTYYVSVSSKTSDLLIMQKIRIWNFFWRDDLRLSLFLICSYFLREFEAHVLIKLFL